MQEEEEEEQEEKEEKEEEEEEESILGAGGHETVQIYKRFTRVHRNNTSSFY